jgi:8-oxo-dGTP diphosphatase
MINDIPPGIKSFLLEDPVRNCNILYFLQDNVITGYQSCGYSLLVTGISDRDWTYFSSANQNEFNNLLSYIIPGSNNFAAVEEWMIPHILERFQCEPALSVNKYYLPDDIRLPEVRNTIYSLTEDDAAAIMNKSEYKEWLTFDYVKDRIKRGISGGIYNGDELIAWAVTHDDGAIGFLTVDEKYRCKGLGSDLTIYMADKVRNTGRIPFVHIEKENNNSISIALKIGFKEYGRISWLVSKDN